jgi:hypothetical protein
MHYCNSIEAPWLVHGGHSASLRHHAATRQHISPAAAVLITGRT